jgi:hypothetical protein
MTEIDRRLDELAKSLADRGHTRRGVLKIGAGAVGAMVAALLPGRVRAAPGQPGGNSACAHFCHAVFDDIDDLAGQCTSQAAHGGGPCVRCAADITRICGKVTTPDQLVCCTPNEQTCCVNPTTGQGTCCNNAKGEFCCVRKGVCHARCPGQLIPDPVNCTCVCPPGLLQCGGDRCVRPCPPPRILNVQTCACECPPDTQECTPGGVCCPTGQVCCGDVCCEPGFECGPGNVCQLPSTCSDCQPACDVLRTCGTPLAGQTCGCFPRVEGGGCFCGDILTGFCSAFTACSSQSECGPGQVCVASCCPTGICISRCGATTAPSFTPFGASSFGDGARLTR